VPQSSTAAETDVVWPKPAHFAAVAVAWSLLVIYGSLTPFAYQPLEWSRAASILRWIIEHPPQPAPRSDWATNFLLLVPIGFAALGRYSWIGIRCSAAAYASCSCCLAAWC